MPPRKEQAPKLERIPEEINNKMRDLASLSVLVTPDLQIAPQERQRARHQHVTSKPLRDSIPQLSPMEQREREAARRKEIEKQREALRDEIVNELQDKYLHGDPSLLFPERQKHNDLHKIQFPLKPFLPVEVSDDGYGLANFPKIVPEVPRAKKRFPQLEQRSELKAVFAENTPEQFSAERSPAEQLEMKHKMLTWKRRLHQKTTRVQPPSIFESSFNNVRSGASSIETKRGIPKNSSSLLPLSGLNASEATGLGPNAPFGVGRSVIYSRAPQVLQEKERNFARHNTQLQNGYGTSSGREPRTEYERMLHDTANASLTARGRTLPVRGQFFRPPVVAPRNREVVTHDADIMESGPRPLPMPPYSMRRVQIV